MVTQLHLQADQPGDYFGQSAQFSGDGFSDMNFVLRAVPQDTFTQWVSSARQGGPPLDRAGYGALSRQSRNVRPFTYRTVEPDLFQAVATQQIPPGPGPTGGRGDIHVHPRSER
jgi:cytochrome o ubiquinol oxidase subunit 2